VVANFKYRLHSGVAGAFCVPVPDPPPGRHVILAAYAAIPLSGNLCGGPSLDDRSALREVHDWQIAQGVSPDLELDVSNDELDSLYN